MDIQSLFFERLEKNIGEKYKNYVQSHEKALNIQKQKIRDWSNLYERYNLKSKLSDNDSHLTDKQKKEFITKSFELSDKYYGISEPEKQLSKEEFYKNCIDRIIEHCDNSHVSRNEIYFT